MSTPIPDDVTRVNGCNCGGTKYHLQNCTLWDLPQEQMADSVNEAEDRINAYVSALPPPILPLTEQEKESEQDDFIPPHYRGKALVVQPIKPGDTVLVRIDPPSSHQEVDLIKGRLEQHLPGVKIVILAVPQLHVFSDKPKESQ